MTAKIISFEAHRALSTYRRASALLERSRRLLVECRLAIALGCEVNSPFYLPFELNGRTSDHIAAAQAQRNGNERS